MATHSSVLAWDNPMDEEPGGLECTGWQSQTWLSTHASQKDSTQKKLLEACMPLAGVFPSWSTAVKARERQGLGRAWAVTESFRPQPSRAFQGSWRETGHCCGWTSLPQPCDLVCEDQSPSQPELTGRAGEAAARRQTYTWDTRGAGLSPCCSFSSLSIQWGGGQVQLLPK